MSFSEKVLLSRRFAASLCFVNMADADSLHDVKSDSDHDLSAADADAEDDEVADDRCIHCAKSAQFSERLP